MALEVEGKWLPSPEFNRSLLKGYNSSRIRQGYVAHDPNGNVVRIRDEDGDLTMTIKGKSAHGSKPEIEMPIKQQVFNELWPLVLGREVVKTRHRVPLIGDAILYGETIDLMAEVDVFEGRHAGLIIIEIETPDVTILNHIRKHPFPWLGLDVTDDVRYANSSLAVDGVPHE
jgi:CYTH domain-containing protein